MCIQGLCIVCVCIIMHVHTLVYVCMCDCIWVDRAGTTTNRGKFAG